MWRGKNVLLGVTGSIAAYKSTFLVRLLKKAGAEVKVVLSPSARDFVTPLSLSTLSKNPVLWEFFDPEDEQGKWNNHVDLALWADVIIIAPATSNTLSKMVSGNCDNLLMGVYMSAKCPVFFAPAMDLDMYKHASTQDNIRQLQDFGNHLIPPGSGELASGLSGEGRMAEPEEILQFVEHQLAEGRPLNGKKLLINAGPTYEPIDAVRFIGNHSSGKMGVALAEKAYELGAEVHLVLGPHALEPQEKRISVERVQTAVEMEAACQRAFEQADIAILAAAISDYRVENPSEKKMKKTGEGLTLKLVENPDILAGLGKVKSPSQLLVGFALETDNAVENARAKLHKKNCDLIVLNAPGPQSGFGTDTNEVVLIGPDTEHKTELKSKDEIAEDILLFICHNLLPERG